MRAFIRAAFATALAAAAFQLTPTAATAMSNTYGFYNITNNDPDDAEIGESQMFLTVTDEGVGSNQVLFKFSNTGPEQSTISNLYWDDGAPPLLSGLAANPFTYSATGIAFQAGSDPSVLPGGSSYSFTATDAADADNPKPNWGVNPGEWVGVTFNLSSGSSIHNVFTYLADADLRVGIRVINYLSKGSEGFINNPQPVPLPAAAWMLMAGLGGLGLLARKKRAA